VKPLDLSERTVLLRMARASIRDPLQDDAVLQGVLDSIVLGPGLEQKRGAFVTLKATSKGGKRRGAALRGCIGTIESSRELYRNVIHNADRAAFHDPRFLPVELKELDELRIEISALTPIEPVESVEGLVLGRDGVQLTEGTARAVFLPQVASEFGWSRDQWLEQLAVKAGLQRDGWKSARLESFRAEVFRENDRVTE
jgi:AmmeMemoRadiSam system protein A